MTTFLMASLGITTLLAAGATAQNAANSSFVTDQLRYVNPLIGTANGGESAIYFTLVYPAAPDTLETGNVFGGASLPYGMAKAVADTDGSSNQGGFDFETGANVTGFSCMHDSGTG
jgi:putative alpha-1,2-mannosidase